MQDVENLNLVEGTNIELARVGDDVSINFANLGNLNSLTTTTKTNVVSAINEINANIGDIGEALDDINKEVIN